MFVHKFMTENERAEYDLKVEEKVKQNEKIAKQLPLGLGKVEYISYSYINIEYGEHVCIQLGKKRYELEAPDSDWHGTCFIFEKLIGTSDFKPDPNEVLLDCLEIVKSSIQNIHLDVFGI